MSTIDAMLHQEEETAYHVTDYLASSSSSPSYTIALDANVRRKMVSWCYQVVDFCKFHREVVEIAVNYLDRFCACGSGAAAVKADLHMFQLATMTCLYTAVKIHESSAMNPSMLSKLSRGVYSEQQVENMEVEILSALRWRMNPPTALAFVRSFLDLFPENLLDQKTREAVYEIAKFQTELSVGSYGLVMMVKPSTTAYCSVANALRSLITDETILQHMIQIIAEAASIDHRDKAVLDIQDSILGSALKEQPSLLDSDNVKTETAGATAAVAAASMTPSDCTTTSKRLRTASLHAEPRSAAITP